MSVDYQGYVLQVVEAENYASYASTTKYVSRAHSSPSFFSFFSSLVISVLLFS